MERKKAGAGGERRDRGGRRRGRRERTVNTGDIEDSIDGEGVSHGKLA